MNVVPLYYDVARIVLRPDQGYTTQELLELAKKLPDLRMLLSCVVCRNLVIDPYKPNTGNCQHNVCRLCVRGPKQLDPKCSNCHNRNDFKTYKENRYLMRLLFCYKSVCVRMKRGGVYSMLGGFRAKNQKFFHNVPSINLPYMTLQEIIQEGSKYDDLMSKFVEDLPHPAIVSNFQSNSYPTQMHSTMLTNETTFFDINDGSDEMPESMQNDVEQQDIDYDMETQISTNYLPNTQVMPIHIQMSNCYETTTTTTTDTTSTLLLPGAVIPMPSATQLSQILPDVRTVSAIEEIPMGVARVAPTLHNGVENANIVTSSGTEKKKLPTIKRRLRIGGVEQIVEKTITSAQAQPLSTPSNHITTIPAISNNTNAPETTTIASTTQIPSQKRKHESGSETDVAAENIHHNTVDRSETKPRRKKQATQSCNVLETAETTVSASSTVTTDTKSTSSKSPHKTEHKFCRCGQLKNSNVTCFRQRCPCYRKGLPCNGHCKCVGCNNPRNKEVTNVTSTTTTTATSTIKDQQQTEQHQQTIEQQKQSPTTVSTTTDAPVQLINGNNNNNNQQQFVNLMPQGQHPPVLIQNENGEYQVVNLCTKNGEPVNPATLGLPPIQLQTSVGGVSSTITAYVMAAEAKVVPLPPVQPVQPIQNDENTAKITDNDSNQMQDATTTTMETEMHDVEQQTDEEEQQPHMQTRHSKKVNAIHMETISSEKTQSSFRCHSPELFDSVDDEHVLANVTSDL